MISREDMESFLIRTELDYEEIGDAIWLVRPQGARADQGVVVSYSPPLVVLRARVVSVPEDEAARLRMFQRLLELNASDLVHGSYGLEDGEVILTDALELENLDFSEFQASLESLTLALTSHRPELARE